MDGIMKELKGTTLEEWKMGLRKITQIACAAFAALMLMSAAQYTVEIPDECKDTCDLVFYYDTNQIERAMCDHTVVCLATTCLTDQFQDDTGDWIKRCLCNGSVDDDCYGQYSNNALSGWCEELLSDCPAGDICEDNEAARQNDQEWCCLCTSILLPY